MIIRWWIATPTGRAGAIASFAIETDVPSLMDEALGRLGAPSTPVGSLRVGVIAGVDRCVIARWQPCRAEVMPHGGVAVMRELARAMGSLFGDACVPGSASSFPESVSVLEARMLDVLARAASPRAIDALLAQPARWADAASPRTGHAAALSRLVDPPLVVAVGPANIGKSSLLNALAGRRAALVADVPGTTRDHVGAMLEVDGLVVRYVDTPGRGVDRVSRADRSALDASDTVLANADLVLACFDATGGPPVVSPDHLTRRVRTRADLGGDAPAGDLSTSARTGAGIDDLAVLIRRALVPDRAIEDPGAWAFWEVAGGEGPGEDPVA